MPSLQDQIIEAIFDALPANNYYEIAEKVSRALRRTVTRQTINNCLAHLRANSAEYGWSVPHVQRGPGYGERFIPLLVDREGHYELDSNSEALGHIMDGASGTLQQVVTMTQNQQAAILLAAAATRKVNLRATLNDLAADYAYLARKAAAVVRDIKAA